MVRYGNPPDKWTEPKYVSGYWAATNSFFEKDPDRGYVKMVQEFISDYHYYIDYTDDKYDDYKDDGTNDNNYGDDYNNYDNDKYNNGQKDDYYNGNYDQGECFQLLMSENRGNVVHCEYNIERNGKWYGPYVKEIYLTGQGEHTCSSLPKCVHFGAPNAT